MNRELRGIGESVQYNNYPFNNQYEEYWTGVRGVNNLSRNGRNYYNGSNNFRDTISTNNVFGNNVRANSIANSPTNNNAMPFSNIPNPNISNPRQSPLNNVNNINSNTNNNRNNNRSNHINNANSNYNRGVNNNSTNSVAVNAHFNNQHQLQRVQPLRSIIQVNGQTFLFKFDHIFAQSFKSLRSSHLFSLITSTTLLLAILLLYKFHAFKNIAHYRHGYVQYQPALKFSILPFLTTFQSIFVLAQFYYLLAGFYNLKFSLQTAAQTNNATVEPANLTQSFDQNISELMLYAPQPIYLGENIDEQRKKHLTNQTQSAILYILKKQLCCSHQLMDISRFGMFISSIVLIIALAKDPTTWLEKLILISTVVFWFLRNRNKFLYIAMMAICPFVTIGVIFWLCFCQGKKKPVEIPKPKNPTQQQILNSGGTCSICMMQFSTSDQVVILPCSDKHIFHEICINGWLSVKSTCPNCRYDLSEER